MEKWREDYCKCNCGPAEVVSFQKRATRPEFANQSLSRSIKASAPWWFVEGGANFSQLAIIYANSFAKYSEERKYEANELLTNRDKKYTEKWITNFIKPPDTSVWREDGRESWHLYDLGILVSLGMMPLK